MRLIAYLVGCMLLSAPLAHAQLANKSCKIGGCSGQLCVPVSDEGISTCEYRAQYACYKQAHCRRLKNGQCGWVMSKKLRACLKNPPSVAHYSTLTL